jgi:hypothetical protein
MTLQPEVIHAMMFYRQQVDPEGRRSMKAHDNGRLLAAL